MGKSKKHDKSWYDWDIGYGAINWNHKKNKPLHNAEPIKAEPSENAKKFVNMNKGGSNSIFG